MASRWWAIAVFAVVAVCGAVLAFSWPARPWAPLGGLILLGVVVAYLTVGRNAVDGSRRAVVFVGVLIVATFGLVALVPALAVFQSLAMPAGWVLAHSRRGGIIASALTALAACAGFLVSLGFTGEALTTAAISGAFSLTGSIALGLWIWRISEYGTERARLLDELTAAQDELAALHRDAGSTAERQRLARELHDTIAQSLAGVVLLAQRTRRDLAAGRLTDDTLETLESAARAALTETRTLVAGSAPVELSGGLAAALEVLAERFRRETGIAVDVTVHLTTPLLRDAEVALLRCAQEGLANIRKHAGATQVTVTLGENAGDAVLRIEDDGRGLDPDAIPDGFGLSGLRARLGLVGGTLSVASDGGTTITARLPREAA
jgi:signal transduction histidine kinase